MKRLTVHLAEVKKIQLETDRYVYKHKGKIYKEINAVAQSGISVSPELTTRLKYSIIEVDSQSERPVINKFVDTLLSRDSLFLRGEIKKLSPDIELQQEVEIGGETVKVDIPMTVNFFWPES